MAASKSVLLLFLGDPTTDRRVQSFARLFREAGWYAEIIAPRSTVSNGPRKFLQHHRALTRAISNKRADVVMACDLYSLSAARDMKQRGTAKQLIYDAREVYCELPAVARRTMRRNVWKRVERKGLLHADHIIVTAPHDLQAVLDIHGFVPRSSLIRNLPWRSDSVQPSVQVLGSLGIPPSTRTLVYVGGLQRGRGLRLILEALPMTDVHLLLIGDGAERATLEAQARSLRIDHRVHFAGPMQSDKALAVAAACDAGFAIVEPLSKSYELALPSKMFEYMMLGLPVITNPMKHVLELFGEANWLCYAELNSRSIADCMKQALGISQQSRNEERALALERYHFEADAERLVELLS